MATAAALDGVARFFSRKASRQGWVARRLLGREDAGDATLRNHLISAIGGSIRPDGSVGGNPLATIAAARELVDLEAPKESLDPPLDWLLALEGRPGAFSDGCSAARHAHRVCEHFLSGFFAPAPPTERVAPATLANGKVYRVESQARFAISCAALEVVLLAGRGQGPGASRHLDSFRHLIDEWRHPGDHLALDLAFGALAAAVAAPARWQPLVDELLEVASLHQLVDGTWQRADFFHAIGAVGRASGPVADRVLDRARNALLQRQRDDGSFGSVAQDERGLIGLRVLLRLGG